MSSRNSCELEAFGGVFFSGPSFSDSVLGLGQMFARRCLPKDWEGSTSLPRQEGSSAKEKLSVEPIN